MCRFASLAEYYKAFVRNGALVAPDQKTLLSEINQKLSKLSTSFRHNILSDESDVYTVLAYASQYCDIVACLTVSASDLDGLSPEFKEGAKASAAELKLPEDTYAILNTR